MNTHNSTERNYINQVLISILFKFMAVGLTFMAVPILIEKFGVSGYGMWSILLSVLMWMNLLDFGLPAYLQTRVAKTNANGIQESVISSEVGQSYVLIAFLNLIMLGFILGSYIFVGTFDLNFRFFDGKHVSMTLVFVGVALAGVNVISSVIHGVVGGMRRSSLVSISQFIAAAMFFSSIFLIQGLSIEMALILNFSFLSVSNFLISLWQYRTTPIVRPKFKLNKKIIYSLWGRGGGFVLINLSVLVLFSTDRLVMGLLTNVESVAAYDLVFKIFGVFLMGHGLISMPLWGPYAYEFERGNFSWIIRMLWIQVLIFLVFFILMFVVLLLMEPLLRLWIGNVISIETSLAWAVLAYVSIALWNNIFAMLINGIGNIALQVKISLVAALINIPISYFLVESFGFGPEGVVWGTVIALLLPGVIMPIQALSFIRIRK